MRHPETGASFRVPTKGSAGSLSSLVGLIETTRRRFGIPYIDRDQLTAHVEDHICSRIPLTECWASGAGDVVHKAIVGTLMKVGARGLAKKARGSSGCKGRRLKMNAKLSWTKRKK